MTLAITGRDLTIDDVVRVAREGQRVALSAPARMQMKRSRTVVERAAARGDEVYGLTTGVGVFKRARLTAADVAEFNRRLLVNHRVAQGPPVPADVARATMLRLANGFASGHPGVRVELAERLVDALNGGDTPVVRRFGSPGLADLAPMADLAEALFAGLELEAGEGLALLNNNAFSTGAAALALHDARRLLDGADAAAALSLEAFAANLTIIHPAVPASRPYPGLAAVVGRLRGLLDGSYLSQAGAARSLQDPASFRDVPQLHGAAWDALTYAETQLGIELNAGQGNPLVLPAEDRIISVANYEVVPVAAALDLVRIALAPVLTSSAERASKLMQSPWSGLPDGLVGEPDSAASSADSGLSIYTIADEALAGEARLLAQPVSFELVSSTGAQGIEDRATMAPLGARRTADMVGLGERVAAVELFVAAQAVELRGRGPLGRGTGRLLELVRERVPFVGPGDALPDDLDALAALVHSGEAATLGRDEARAGKVRLDDALSG